MLTLYHPDGSRPAPDAGRGSLARREANRLHLRRRDEVSGTDAPHLVGLVVLFLDADHMTQQWTHQEAPGKTHTSDFKFTRKK
jgi:hypothetical protein